jgi:hypothetical protein
MGGPGPYITDPMPRDALADSIRVLPIDMQLSLTQASQTPSAPKPAVQAPPAPQPAAPAQPQPSWWSSWRDWLNPMPGPMM